MSHACDDTLSFQLKLRSQCQEFSLDKSFLFLNCLYCNFKILAITTQEFVLFLTLVQICLDFRKVLLCFQCYFSASSFNILCAFKVNLQPLPLFLDVLSLLVELTKLNPALVDIFSNLNHFSRKEALRFLLRKCSQLTFFS